MARQRRMGATARERERYFGDVGCVGADIPVDSCAGARRVASQALLDLHAEARAFRPDHAAMARMRLPVDQQLKMGGMPNVLTKLRPAPRVLRSETVHGFSWLEAHSGPSAEIGGLPGFSSALDHCSSEIVRMRSEYVPAET
jgi:hypothetical protein